MKLLSPALARGEIRPNYKRFTNINRDGKIARNPTDHWFFSLERQEGDGKCRSRSGRVTRQLAVSAAW